jgi:hypothetical protein
MCVCSAPIFVQEARRVREVAAERLERTRQRLGLSDVEARQYLQVMRHACLRSNFIDRILPYCIVYVHDMKCVQRTSEVLHFSV